MYIDFETGADPNKNAKEDCGIMFARPSDGIF
jgi:hypothetical protein